MQNYVENIKKSFLGKSSQKKKYGQIWSKKSKLSVKAETWYQETNLNIRNSVILLTFSVFDQKHLFVQI